MWWAIVETRPGSGYPKDWEKRTAQGVMPADDDYEAVPEFTYQQLVGSDGSQPPRLLPKKTAEFGPNWDDDVGEGTTPSDTWFFHLHMACMHCTEPSCVAACPTKAIYRRPDGIVLINRVKPHTSFKGKYESGLMKMMAIGLGKQEASCLPRPIAIIFISPLSYFPLKEV